MTQVLLLIAIIWLVALKLRVRSHRRAVEAVCECLEKHQTILQDDIPATAGEEWDAFCVQANKLTEEVLKLRQERTDQLSQLEATLGSLQEAVLVVDSNNYILLANSSLRAMFPFEGEIIGERLELVLQSADFINFVSDLRKGTARPRHEIEFVVKAHSIWVEATGTTISSLRGSKTPALLLVLHDITKQRRLESIRKEFVANVSHELRTPLSMIKGYIETLVDGHEDIPVSDRDRFLKIIQRHTDRLNSLLEDLLALSRLESVSPGLSRETYDLGRLIESIVDDYKARPSAAEHKLSCEVHASVPPLFIDPLKLTQLFENLLDNALKYTPKGSWVRIDARLRGTMVEVRIEDNGPGIPAADLPHIFERFYRVDKGRSREKGGTGLGLSIVKHIAQLHGGRIHAESRVGQGTVFVLHLPVEAHAGVAMLGH